MLTKIKVCCFLLNLSIVYGFGQDIIGLPAEHDLDRYNGFLSNWVQFYENNDSENVVGDESIENMLDKFHRVRKRSANADEATINEGTNSTTPPSNGTAIQTVVSANNESLTNSTANKSEPKNAIEVSPPLNLNATEQAHENVTKTSESTESIPTATEPTKGNGTTTESPTAPKGETTTSDVLIEAMNTTTSENTTKPKEVETEIKQSDKNATEDKVLLGENPDQVNSTIPPVLSTTNHPETHLKTFADDKKGRKAIEKEHMDHHQSGNAVLTNADKTMSETDVSLGEAAAHESIKTVHEVGQPKDGASSSTAAASTGNDTKIIIFLGVAVAVVGVAAVGYNYTRKRRRTNRGSPRTGQNGDVETGREMKPLMRRDPEAEIKKEAEVKAEEIK